MEKILVVDDDFDIRDSLSAFLSSHGYDVETAQDARDARHKIANTQPDAILLDVMMPGESGLDFCRDLRVSSEIPILILSARGKDMDRIMGLELGADDYISKPFNPRELLARLRSVLRRSSDVKSVQTAGMETFVMFDQWTLERSKWRLRRDDGLIVSLSEGELALIEAFVKHPNMVLTRAHLLDLTQPDGDEDLFDRSIDSQISRFRKKIEEDPKNPKIIETVWGGGYRLASDVRHLKAPLQTR